MFKLDKKRGFKLFALFAGALITVSSCKKALDILPEDRLDREQMYNTLADADAAVMGIYGQFGSLGERYILFNELRADLMDVTSNASPELRQLSEHNVAANNPYADPTPFYKVILNCNDAIKNLKLMADQSKISQADFEQRYSDLVCLRSFIYFQLGIHYGNIPYITEPIENVEDLKASNDFPKINLTQLIDSLIQVTSTLPYIENDAYPTSSSLNFFTDGFDTRRIFINKPQLIGELYLWKGEYFKAAEWFKKNLTGTDQSANVTEQVDYNRISYNFGNVNFTRSQTASSLENSTSAGWRSLFAQPNTSHTWKSEWTWGIPYRRSVSPGNPFMLSAEYLVKPSQKVIDLWDSQILTNGVPGDARGTLSYSTSLLLGEPVITKFLDATNMWNIYRAAGTHLKFAEAANRDGQGKLAYALLNNGIQNTFYDGTFSSSGTKIPANMAELNTQATPYPVSSPYYFDARDNLSVARGLWYRNRGIRARAWMPRLELPGITYKDPEQRVIADFNVDMTLLEDKLIEEAALELAFEGTRWADLVRIARRRNDPTFLADKIRDKLLAAGNPGAATAAHTKLMQPENWYLPFKIK